MSGGEAALADAMRAAFVRWLAREARGALGVFRPEAIAARMGCDLSALCSEFTRLRLAERHGFSGLWRLTPAGQAAVRAAREAATGHAEGAGDGPDAAPDDAPGIVAPLLAALPGSRPPQAVPQGAPQGAGEGA